MTSGQKIEYLLLGKNLTLDNLPMLRLRQLKRAKENIEAGEILLIATSESKAGALHQAVRDPVSNMCPTSALQTHRNCTVVCDEHAAGKRLISR
jgi:hypothetical protein